MRVLPSRLPYVLPLAVFLILSQFEMSFGMGLYPYLYTLKAAIIAAILILFVRSGAYPELQLSSRYLGIATLLGIALCALWVGIGDITPHSAIFGSRAGLNPF